MKRNMMRGPLVKSAVILIILTLMAYLTSASPDTTVLGSLGLIIIGAIRLVQWSIAMVIGLAVCIAFLIGIFLLAASMVNKEAAGRMFVAAKAGITEMIGSAICSIKCIMGKEAQCCSPKELAAPKAELGAVENTPAEPSTVEVKDELQSIISMEMQKVNDSQQSLSDQFAAINDKLEALEAKTGEFAAATQLETITSDIASSGEVVNAVKEQIAALEAKISETAAKIDSINPEKILGDIPNRLEKVEQEDTSFDPQPLTEAIAEAKTGLDEAKASLEEMKTGLETVKTDLEEVKKKPAPRRRTTTKTTKTTKARATAKKKTTT
nr:hypothetical protein [uncultured Desulfobulbus sp.]